MNNFLLFYSIFSYLFIIGIVYEYPSMRLWNIIFAPIIMPILLGMFLQRLYRNSSE